MLTQTDANRITYFDTRRRKANPIGNATAICISKPYGVCVKRIKPYIKVFCKTAARRVWGMR